MSSAAEQLAGEPVDVGHPRQPGAGRSRRIDARQRPSERVPALGLPHDGSPTQPRPGPRTCSSGTSGLGPNRLWLAHFTYVRARAGFIYLAGCSTCFSCRLVGCTMSGRMRVVLVLWARRWCCSAATSPAGQLVHSFNAGSTRAWRSASAPPTPASARSIRSVGDATQLDN